MSHTHIINRCHNMQQCKKITTYAGSVHFGCGMLSITPSQLLQKDFQPQMCACPCIITVWQYGYVCTALSCYWLLVLLCCGSKALFKHRRALLFLCSGHMTCVTWPVTVISLIDVQSGKCRESVNTLHGACVLTFVLLKSCYDVVHFLHQYSMMYLCVLVHTLYS